LSNFGLGDVVSGDQEEYAIWSKQLKEDLATVESLKASGRKPNLEIRGRINMAKSELARLSKIGDIKNAPKQGIDDLITTSFKKINKDMEEYYSDPMAQGSVYTTSPSINKDYHTFVLTKLNFQGHKDTPVTFEYNVNEYGKVLGVTFKQKLSSKNKDGEYETRIVNEKSLSINEAEALNIKLDYKMGQRYDARTPNKARRINLGDAVDNRLGVPSFKVGNNDYKKVTEDFLAETDKVYGRPVAQHIGSIADDFWTGKKYEVRLEPADPDGNGPDQSQYYAFVYNKKTGKRELGGLGKPLGYKITNADQLVQNSNQKATEFFFDILSEYRDVYTRQ
jgi:hypothetical protein